MASFPAYAQTFTFAAGQKTLDLTGRVTKWTGKAARRSATHQYPGRAGAREEDMEQGPEYLEAVLEFIGTDCAAKFKEFQDAVRKSPTGLLVHPVAGRWQAFCSGPSHTVDLSQAVNRIECTCSWKETELDRQVQPDTPDVSTAQQSITAQMAFYQQEVAKYMCQIASAQAPFPARQLVISAVLDTLSLAAAPIAAAQGAINSVMGSRPAVIAAVNSIASAANALTASVDVYVASADDLFAGDEASSAISQSTETLLGQVTADAAALVEQLKAANPTPAGAGDATMETLVLLDDCMTLSDAIEAARPPTVWYTVPQQSNLLVLAQQLIVQKELFSYSAKSYAAAVRALNEIPDPGRIPAGAKIKIPTR